MIARLRFAWLLVLPLLPAACGDEGPSPQPPSPLEFVACSLPAKTLGACYGLATTLCRPGVDPSGSPPAGTIGIEYDPQQQPDRVRLHDRQGVPRFEAVLDWDSQGRLSAIDEDLDGDGDVDRLTRVSWPSVGLPDQLTVEAPDGTLLRLVDLDYQQGFLQERTTRDGEGTPLSFERYDWTEGRLAWRTLEDGQGTPREFEDQWYDGQGRLSGRTLRDGEGNAVSMTRWDWQDDRMTGRTDLGPDGFTVRRQAAYGYDAEGRLRDETRTGDADRTLEYRYDARGNLASVTVTSPL